MDPRVTSPRFARLGPEDDDCSKGLANRQRCRFAGNAPTSSSSGQSAKREVTRGSIPFGCGNPPDEAERSSRAGTRNRPLFKRGMEVRAKRASKDAPTSNIEVQ
jgi:hypothetical protein